MKFFNKKVSPFDLDWGEVTPDRVLDNSKKIFYINNHFHLSEESRALSRIFSSGRVVWYSKHVPENYAHHIRLDMTGQKEAFDDITDQKVWKQGVLDMVSKYDENIELIIDFIF